MRVYLSSPFTGLFDQVRNSAGTLPPFSASFFMGGFYPKIALGSCQAAPSEASFSTAAYCPSGRQHGNPAFSSTRTNDIAW
jgi:hypothetical protein